MKSFGKLFWAQIVVAALSCCFLAFVAGAFISEFQWFPYSYVFRDAFTYLHARDEQAAMEAETDRGAKLAVVPAAGHVTVPATVNAQDGYTFLTFDFDRPSVARLIDMQGKVLHEWHRAFREIWPNPPHKEKPSAEDSLAWRYGHLFPNGDIIVSIVSYGDTPYGYGLVKLDKDSNVIWAVADNFHHHFSIGANGHIYGLTHAWRNLNVNPIPGEKRLTKQRVLEDFVVELTPDGKEVSRVSLLDALATSGYLELLDSSFVQNFRTRSWDPIHANDVEVVDAAFPAPHPFAKAGQVLVSARDVDALLLIDLESKKIVWSMRGAWVRQHDPDILPNGDVLLFDNRGGTQGKVAASRLIELDPKTGKIVWSYAGSAENPFRSDKSGAEQRLTNGNTLISEDDGGRVFEIDPSGAIQWEYKDVRLHQATRIDRDWVKFTPKPPVLTETTTTQPAKPTKTAKT